MSESDTWNWDSDRTEDSPTSSTRAIDLSFKLNCNCLHVDHSAALSKAISHALPWFQHEPLAGLHLVYLAGSQNGWQKPEGPEDLLYLSRRTRLTIRVPIDKTEEAHTLTGQVLDIAGNSMEIGKATEKPVMVSDILIARHVIAHDDNNENEFLQAAAQQLKNMRIQFKKLLPGKQLQLRGPDGIVKTRSLMVADIEPEDSLTLQEQGIGEGRSYGCGLFIHHKGIKTVSES